MENNMKCLCSIYPNSNIWNPLNGYQLWEKCAGNGSVFTWLEHWLYVDLTLMTYLMEGISMNIILVKPFFPSFFFFFFLMKKIYTRVIAHHINYFVEHFVYTEADSSGSPIYNIALLIMHICCFLHW